MLRVQDVIDSYGPDILTFDDGANSILMLAVPERPDLGVWLGIPDLAPEIIHTSTTRTSWRMPVVWKAVVDLKEVPEPIWGTLTRDFEMSLAGYASERTMANRGLHRELALRPYPP